MGAKAPYKRVKIRFLMGANRSLFIKKAKI